MKTVEADFVAWAGSGYESNGEDEDGDPFYAPPIDLVFLPGDPPRYGTFVAYLTPGTPDPPVARQRGPSTAAFGDREMLSLPLFPGQAPFGGSVELVLAAGNSVRRRDVPAHDVPVPKALEWLAQLHPAWSVRPSVAAWSDAVVAGLGILARGRLYPSVTPEGWDAWRAGPFDPGDTLLLKALAASLPPSAHCVPSGDSSPIRMMSPTYAVHAVWDAMADSLVRTGAAPAVAGSDLFTTTEAREVQFLAGWLADSGRLPEGGAKVGLRVVLDEGVDRSDNETATTHMDDGAEIEIEEEDTGPIAVVQMTSLQDPSLVVDAAELFSMPPAVLARLDPDAETNLLLALRRGSRAWEPLGALLTERIPSALALTDEEVEDLLGQGGEALRSAGIEVLWPSSLLFEGLALQATVQSPPEVEGDGTFSIHDMVKFDWRLTLGGELLDADEVEQLAEAKRSIVRLRGRWVRLDPELLERARRRRDRAMTAMEALAAVMAGEITVETERTKVIAEGAIAAFAQQLKAVGDLGTESLGPPPGLAGQLRPYQERGVAWLYQMCELGLGACLADDMGLGKTIQVIGLHLHRLAAAGLDGQAKEGTRRRKTKTHVVSSKGAASAGAAALIVCPTSLLGNWAHELARFAPGVPVRRFHGPERTLEDLGAGEVVITTYGVARRDRDLLAEASFSLVVADEAQHAKNPLSDTARALRSIGGRHRVALTGTPVENRLSELWSILDWTTPGLLGPLERFRRTIALPVEKRHDPEATERLTRTVRPFLLRRRKTDPAIAPDLPPRTVTDLPVALTPEQVTLYEAEVREALETIKRKSGIERQGLVFRMMTVLKQICNHPAQYLHQSGPIAGRSGKLAALEELLGVILDEGDSVLVFSQYVELCALLEDRLAELGIGTAFLHGSVPVRRREEMVAAFQAGRVPVFLLSLKAGGVGLNLTRATHVVHYDRWWNPAVEDQATDRAHRIGQDRPVQVHRLVTEGTLEDRIAELLEKKRNLAETVVGEGEAWVAELSDDQLAELVKLGAP